MLAQVVSNTVPPIITDIGRVITDICPTITLDQSVALVGAVFLIARTLRKAIPDNLQTGKLGTFLAHVALEINPKVLSPASKPVETVKSTPYPQ